MSKFRCGGQLEKSTRASALMSPIFPTSSLSGTASARTIDTLAELHAAAFRLFEPGRHAQRRQVRHFGNDLPGPCTIAGLEIGRRTARSPVRHDRHHAIDRCQNLEPAKLALRVVHVVARLVALLNLAAQFRFLDVPQRLQFPLGLREPRLRVPQRELLLLALHPRQEFARRRVQLGAPHVVARLRPVRLCLLLLNAVLRARLPDFLFCLLMLGAPVVEGALDGHWIELDDDITFFDRHAVGCELEDLQIAAARVRYRQREPNASPSLRRAPAGSR